MPAIEVNSMEAGASLPKRLADPVILIARAFMAYIFIVEGYGKIGGYSGVADYMAGHGVPAILFGFAARWAALALAGFAILTAIIFHGFAVDQAVEFQKNLAMAGGFLVLAVLGPGGWSLDGWRSRMKAEG